MDILEVIALLSLCIACSERTPAYRGGSLLGGIIKKDPVYQKPDPFFISAAA